MRCIKSVAQKVVAHIIASQTIVYLEYHWAPLRHDSCPNVFETNIHTQI